MIKLQKLHIHDFISNNLNRLKFVLHASAKIFQISYYSVTLIGDTDC